MKENRKSNTKLVIMLGSMVSIVLVLFIAFTANRYIQRMSVNNAELYNAFRISELMKLFRANILVLEAKQRGYLVTGDPKFLEAYKLKESETKTYLKAMEKYFSGKPEEEAFYKLKDLTYKKLQEAKDLSHSNDGLPGAKADPSVTINIMDEINSTINAINESLGSTTKALLDNSVEYVNASKKWSYREIAIGILTAVLVVIVLFRDINLRNQLQEELKIAKAKADQNALMKEQFMANMSHEIRTPMNAIVGFTDLLQKTTLDPAQRDYLSAIRTSGSNLLNIINDILDFSKIEAGKLQIEKIPFSLNAVTDPLKLIFTEKAKEKNISFSLSLDPKTPALLFGDPTRLTQILVNLLGNAVKFTLTGEVSLRCEVKSIEHDVVQLVFRIKDSGIGIPADKIGDVFERFNQGNAATTRRFGGTGLGLSIVKSLVEIQNGEISVKSKEGSGTEFTVVLSYPVSYENVSTIPQATSAGLKIPSEKQLKVLLAEDNTLNQKLATIYLNAFGLKVEIAENGLDAVEKTKSGAFDLVLMDIQMPVLDGYNAVKQIRDSVSKTLPVIAMTAHTMEGEREKCISYGMNDYISKPFTEMELFNVVNKYIGSSNEQTVIQPVLKTTGAPSGNVDLEQLFALSRGNNGFIKEMIGIFLEQNPLDLTSVENAIAANDFETIRAVSHKMKTSLGFMGMSSMLQPLSTIERLSSENRNIEEIAAEFRNIKTTCLSAAEELKQVLINLKTV